MLFLAWFDKVCSVNVSDENKGADRRRTEALQGVNWSVTVRVPPLFEVLVSCPTSNEVTTTISDIRRSFLKDLDRMHSLDQYIVRVNLRQMNVRHPIGPLLLFSCLNQVEWAKAGTDITS